ncbi:hypothetical protein VZ95_05310 [Elstera litoralis]|uniref:Uncharacterized protein n=1 Tax=Elstera litoralis TaxID=552518 RepID=A0A0F3IV00_9PROT|nr:hypothetical protein [Elstera litoralis]KJV10378.1 hypothetical protein VZ95_05310 [Elstera litoralis]
MNYSGLAKIIPFVPRAQVRVGPPWSTAELGELFRVAHVLRQSGMMVETDMGLSDEGDPWFVFYNSQTEDVIAHFARINGEIMVHGLSANGLVSGVDLSDVIRRLKPVQAMESQQKSQAERSVVFHPFMLLVAFVAASFLATEESQAASGPLKAGEAGDHRAADATKIKADWIDRAMTLLNSKGKDRADAGASDAPGSRKMSAGETTTQHSMALAMLAAAITQANQIDNAEFTADAIDLAVETKNAALPHQLVADDVSPQGDAAVGSDGVQGNAAPVPTVVSAHNADQPGADYNPNAGAAGTATLSGNLESASGLPLLTASVSVATPVASELSSAAAFGASLLSQEHLVPETASFGTAPATAGAVTTIVGKATVSTLAASAIVSTGPTSFDLTLDGGTLQFHQSLVDIRLLELVAGQGNTQELGGKGGAVSAAAVAILVEGQNGKTLTLTDAHESVLIEKGNIQIKNFTFGVDQLILQDPSLMAHTPEVLFSYTGDIIIRFNETTRVTLIGVFQASEMVMGVASVEAV